MHRERPDLEAVTVTMSQPTLNGGQKTHSDLDDLRESAET